MSVKIYGDGATRVGVRRITDKLYWIAHSAGDQAAKLNRGFAEDFARINPGFDPEANDIFYSSYLFLDEKTFLIDTLGPAQHFNILEALSDLLQGRPLDHLWISHTELPHAANTAAIARAYPDLEILTVGGHDHYAVHGLGDARRVNFGEVIDLGSHQIQIIEPLFLDHALTQWIYEPTIGFLCPVDWALNAHNPKHSFKFMDEIEAFGYSPERFMTDVSITNCVVFPWLRFADPDDIVRRIDEFYAAYDIRIFAPSHTNVIRTNTAPYLEALKQAMRRVVSNKYEMVY